MRNIEKIQNLHWKWNGKLEPLGKMRNSKLEYIRNFVMTHLGFYSNISSEQWASDIKYLLDYRKTNRKYRNTVDKVEKLVSKL